MHPAIDNREVALKESEMQHLMETDWNGIINEAGVSSGHGQAAGTKRRQALLSDSFSVDPPHTKRKPQSSSSLAAAAPKSAASSFVSCGPKVAARSDERVVLERPADANSKSILNCAVP